MVIELKLKFQSLLCVEAMTMRYDGIANPSVTIYYSTSHVFNTVQINFREEGIKTNNKGC